MTKPALEGEVHMACSLQLLRRGPNISSRSISLSVKPLSSGICVAVVCVSFELLGSKYLSFSTFSVFDNWVLRLKLTLEPCVEDGEAFEAQTLEKLWSPFRHPHFPHTPTQIRKTCFETNSHNNFLQGNKNPKVSGSLPSRN